MSSDDQQAREERDARASRPEDSSAAEDAAESPDTSGPTAEQPVPDSGPSKVSPSEEAKSPDADESGVVGAQAPPAQAASSVPDSPESERSDSPTPDASEEVETASQQPDAPEQHSADEPSSTASYYDDPYADEGQQAPHGGSGTATASTAVVKPPAETSEQPPPPPPPPSGGDGGGGDDEEEGMVRMSFLDHLGELRTRILRALIGLGIAYPLCLLFARQLFELVRGPYDMASEQLPQYDSPLTLVAITPMESFHMLYLKIPILAAVFLTSPWLMYQVWAFIAPGLYKKERRWALPFVFSTATLFILGGVFGYFVMLRFALVFLVGIGFESDIQPMISVSSYFNLFITLLLGLGIVFQMPVLIFSLTLLRITTPSFLLKNIRYAILIMFVIAAVITPTPDVANMTLFAAPMILLFYVGIGASYLLVWKRETGRMPWGSIVILVVLIVVLVLGGVLYYLHSELGHQFINEFPWIVSP